MPSKTASDWMWEILGKVGINGDPEDLVEIIEECQYQAAQEAFEEAANEITQHGKLEGLDMARGLSSKVEMNVRIICASEIRQRARQYLAGREGE